jgi:hypothetical protein
MKRKTTTVVVLAAILAIGITVVANGHTSSVARHTTVRVDGKLTSTKRIDVPPHGDSPGDVSLASGELLSPRTHQKVGNYLLDCTNIPPQTGQCSITFALHGGHIAVLASFGPGFSGNTSATDPVVGGTGIYRAARGYDTETETGNGTMTFTFHLTQ